MGDVIGSIGTGIGDIGSAVGSGLSGLATGAENVGGDLLSGAQSLVGGLGSSLGGLFGLSGGGGPVSPGTIANTTAAGVNPTALAGAGAAAPAAATSAASFSAPPGVTPIDPLLSAAGQATEAPPVAPGPLTAPFSAPGAGSNFLSSIINPKTALPLGLLSYDILRGSQNPAEVKQLQALSAQQQGIAANQGQLASAEQEGILPTGGQQLVQQTLQANEAAIRSKYAQMGMSGSTAETQDLQAARDQSLAQTFQIGNQLATTGFNEVNAATGESSSLLEEILAQETAQGNDLGNALALFASGLAK